jgi:predicted RNA-binding Zn-ribbon protein involved in translation (DUF1610 family)
MIPETASNWESRLAWLKEVADADSGICIDCGIEVSGVGKDVLQARCPKCGANSVVGGAVLYQSSMVTYVMLRFWR